MTALEDPARSIVLSGHEERVNAVAISPDNRWVVTGSEDGSAMIWDMTAKVPGAGPVALRGHSASVNTLAVSPDSRRVVTGSEDSTVNVWTLTEDNLTAKLIALACQTAARDLTKEEWDRYLGGKPYHAACP